MRSRRLLSQFALRLQFTAVLACFSVVATAQVPVNDSIQRAPSESATLSTPDVLPVNYIGFPDAIVPTLTPLPPRTNEVSSGQIDPSCMDRTKLTGDWWGARSELIENGVNFDASTTQYYQGVASGGLQQGFRYGGRND